jgi:hypothetical protein
MWMVQIFMLIAAIIEIFAVNWKHWLAAKILNVRKESVIHNGTKLRMLNFYQSM